MRMSSDDYDCILSEFNWSCLLYLFDVWPPDNACDVDTDSDSGVTVSHSDGSLLLPEDLFSGTFTASLHVVHHNVQGFKLVIKVY